MPKKKAEKFPLTLHGATGQWSKCFSMPGGRRKTIYFGTDRDAALAKYLAERADWQAGVNPRESLAKPAAAISLADLVNLFLERSKRRVAEGAISPLTFADYLDAGRKMVEHFGRDRDPQKLGPRDFAGYRAVLAKRYSPVRLSKLVVMSRSMFKWAFQTELLESTVRFGADFQTAGKRAERTHRAASGAKLLTAAEIRALLQYADAQMRAMILLGINGGLGNHDIGTVPMSAFNFEGAFLDFPRVKTGTPRKIPLWPETAAAIRDVLETRRPGPDHSQLLFVTRDGGPLVSIKLDGKRVDQIVNRFRRLATLAGIHRPRMGFYWLRHVFQSAGDEARDPLATSHIMGHIDSSMAGRYRESISDDRLRRVTDHIRGWLFEGENKELKPAAKRKPQVKANEKPALRIVG